MIDITIRKFVRGLLAALLILAGTAQLHAVAWLPFGPDGGDVRSFAADPADPAHVYMGTANGWIYESTDGGASWHRLARVGNRDDLVLDSIVVDQAHPRHIVVGAWVLDHPDGGLYMSEDGGHTWAANHALRGQSVRALAAAPSAPSVMIAGALSGVYRSSDSGRTWQQISPVGSTEIHEIESLAVDPKDPHTIYAGTWHLPWKTTDGGAHWKNIKEGIIEDSDVFSIIVDQREPRTMYASACSGIYKSENAGEQFHKVQGIPSTARRTRKLMQDPQRPEIVFAGTTEGLWRTSDAGKNWMRMTRPEDIVNDIYIDPTHTDHILVATDRGGVLMSNDGGFTYKPSNRGFSARQIAAYAQDPRNPARLYVGVLNDKDSGGVFTSADGGISWSQRADGLNGRDVFALTIAPDNTVIAGTNHGIFTWQETMWMRYGAGNDPAPITTKEDERTGVPPLHVSEYTGGARYMTVAGARSPVKKKALPPHATKSAPVSGYDGAVYGLATAGNMVYAATQQGLMASGSSGASWRQIVAAGTTPLRFVAAHDSTVLAADLKRMVLSTDAGKSWTAVKLPIGLTQLASVAVDGEGELWAVGGEGIWYSEDGAHWSSVPKLNLNDVNSVYYDAAGGRVLVTANNSSTFACGITVKDKSSQCWDSGWNLRMLRPVGDHFVGVTLFDGVVVQPRMIESSF